MPRDTDRDWTEIGRAQPYFGVLANERYLADRIDPEAISEFFESGEADIAKVLEVHERLTAGKGKLGTALDFGCGVGRLSLAMATHAETVYGIDVSEPMLEVARSSASDQGIENVRFCNDIPDTALDWINSLIVFQHIAPERGLVILEELMQRLNPGGFISVQVTFFKDSRHLGEIERDVDSYRYDGRTVDILRHREDHDTGAMTMYDYDLNRVLALLFGAGLERLELSHTDHGGCHGAYIFGVRDS